MLNEQNGDKPERPHCVIFYDPDAENGKGAFGWNIKGEMPRDRLVHALELLKTTLLIEQIGAMQMQMQQMKAAQKSIVMPGGGLPPR